MIQLRAAVRLSLIIGSDAVILADFGCLGGLDLDMATASDGQVATKKAERRKLHFHGLDELESELMTLKGAEERRSLRTSGNWTLGQQADHLARFWEASLDGFPRSFRPPFPSRLGARLFFKKGALRGDPPPPGLWLPKGGAFLLPDGSVDAGDGIARLRRCIERTRAGDAFVAESPLFGKLSRDEWVTLNLGHCALHLGFAHPA